MHKKTKNKTKQNPKQNKQTINNKHTLWKCLKNYTNNNTRKWFNVALSLFETMVLYFQCWSGNKYPWTTFLWQSTLHLLCFKFIKKNPKRRRRRRITKPGKLVFFSHDKHWHRGYVSFLRSLTTALVKPNNIVHASPLRKQGSQFWQYRQTWGATLCSKTQANKHRTLSWVQSLC